MSRMALPQKSGFGLTYEAKAFSAPKSNLTEASFVLEINSARLATQTGSACNSDKLFLKKFLLHSANLTALSLQL